MAEKPLTICVVSRRFPPFSGGAENQLSLIARGLARSGHTVHVLTGRGADPDRITPAKMHILAEPSIKGLGTLIFLLHLALILLLHRRQYDVVLTSMPNETLVISALCSKASRSLLVCRLSNIMLNLSWINSRILPSVYFWAIRQANALIGQTDEFAQQAQAAGLPVERMSVIPNAVDPRFLLEIRKPVARASKPVSHILWCGRFAPQKNPHVMVEVASRLRDFGTDFVVDMVGDGPLVESVQQAVNQMNLKEHMLLHGEVVDTVPFYRQADAFCLTSSAEGQPNVVLEAMASRVPVIATDLPATRSLIENGKTGFLVPSGQVELFANGLNHILTLDKEALLSKDAYNAVCAKHSLPAIAAQYTALFQSLLLQSQSRISMKDFKS